MQKSLGRAHVGVTIFLIVVATAVLFATGKPSIEPQGAQGTPDTSIQESTKQHSIQIKNLPFITPQLPTETAQLPTGTAGCNHDQGQPIGPDCVCNQAYLFTCRNKICIDVQPGPGIQNGQHGCAASNAVKDWCADPTYAGNGNGVYCIGKPVIYLYPEKTTTVKVKLTVPGNIYLSIPKYPSDGWENVIAEPNGTLHYENNTYHELYYESSVKNITAPHGGIIIPMNNLRSELIVITSKLGLLQKEQEEFLQYWMPKLENLHSNYILFSLISPQEKERIDHIDITPKPDTFIAFLAYFKPLPFPISVTPLIFPKLQLRTGFTAVEWGGTIEN